MRQKAMSECATFAATAYPLCTIEIDLVMTEQRRLEEQRFNSTRLKVLSIISPLSLIEEIIMMLKKMLMTARDMSSMTTRAPWFIRVQLVMFKIEGRKKEKVWDAKRE